MATKSDLRSAIVELKHDLTMRGIAGLIAAGGILFAALHLWPPHAVDGAVATAPAPIAAPAKP